MTTHQLKRGAKYTPETFLIRAHHVHGDRYDYSGVVIPDPCTVSSKILIRCREHGTFTQTIVGHINRRAGCKHCAGMAQYTIETFLIKAQEVHGDKYDYSSVIHPLNTKSSLQIRCPSHGMFTQLLATHITKRAGCPSCVGLDRFTLTKFKTKAVAKHGGKYDYSVISELDVVNNKSKVTIHCRGCTSAFTQQISAHLRGSGCPTCNSPERLSLASFTTRASKIHNSVYNYTSVVWNEGTTSSTMVEITCPAHGIFTQQLYSHMRGHGCPSCGNLQRYTFDSFVARARKVHGDRYDYSLVSAIPADQFNSNLNVAITCRNHGVFNQLVSNHISNKNGCPKCKSSRGENLIANWLVAHNISFMQEHRFSYCKNPNTNRTLPFDFWLPDHNLCIEFHGKQHYEPVMFTKSRDPTDAYINQQFRDSVKQNFCTQHSIHMLVISYQEVHHISEILSIHVTIPHQA